VFNRSGIYASPGVIFSSLGSVGLLLLFWALAPIFAFGASVESGLVLKAELRTGLMCIAGLSLYSELASMFPNRSGAEVVYLEQAYPRPKFLVSTLFAVTAILLSFVTILLSNILGT
jgi:hypothetical protein